MWMTHRREVLILLGSLLFFLTGCSLFISTEAVIEVSQMSGIVPLTISYNASASEGRDGISTYRWSFGSGADIYSISGSYTFNHAGQYEIQLTIRAVDGTVDTDTITIEVEPAFWVADENLDEIYKLDAAGNVVMTLDSPESQPRGLALTERGGDWFLYVVCMGNGFQRLVEIDAESGTLLAEYIAPAQDPGGLAYAPNSPQRLWHVDRLSRKIYEINPTDGVILNAFGATYFQSSPHLIDSVFLQTPGGIAWREDSQAPGSLWVLETETKLLYELEIVPASDIFSSTQLELQADPISLSSGLFPISGIDWHEGFLWVVERDRSQITQIDPATGLSTGFVLRGFPGAAVTGLAIQK